MNAKRMIALLLRRLLLGAAPLLLVATGFAQSQGGGPPGIEDDRVVGSLPIGERDGGGVILPPPPPPPASPPGVSAPGWAPLRRKAVVAAPAPEVCPPPLTPEGPGGFPLVVLLRGSEGDRVALADASGNLLLPPTPIGGEGLVLWIDADVASAGFHLWLVREDGPGAGIAFSLPEASP